MYFTFNDFGEIGCHDATYEQAAANLAINQELYPAEHWEMALMYDDNDTILLN